MKRLILLAALMPLAVSAQNPPATMPMPDMGQMFLDEMDMNQDGKVTLDEFRQPTDNKFQMMDRDNNGVVTAEEARNFARMMIQRIQQMQQMQQQQRPMPRQ